MQQEEAFQDEGDDIMASIDDRLNTCTQNKVDNKRLYKIHPSEEDKKDLKKENTNEWKESVKRQI